MGGLTLLRALALSNVRYRPYEGHLIVASCAMRHQPNIFYGAAGHHKTILGGETASLDRRTVNNLPQLYPVVRMRSVDDHLDSELGRSLALEYSISLLGPVDFSARDIPTETAGAAQSLRLGEIFLASAQRLFGLLPFGSFAGFPHRATNRRRQPR